MLDINDQAIRRILEDLIIHNESGGQRHPKVYLDSRGIKTIGHGFNLERRGARAAVTAVGADYDRIVNGTDSLTDAQITQLFEPDVDHAIDGARRVVSSFDQLSIERQIVIVDMVFNMGEGGLANFTDMLAALDQGDFEVAADEMQQSRWFRQVGNRAVRNVASMRSGKLESADYSQFQQALDRVRASTGNKAQKDAKDGVKEGKDGKEASKESKDGKDGKDGAKERKETKDGKETKEGKEKETAKESKDGKDGVKEGKDGKEVSKENKESKDGKDGAKEHKEGKETKEGKEKETAKESKDGKDATKESKEGKDGKEASKDSKDGKDGKDGTKERKETKDGKETKEGKDKEASKESKDGKDATKEGKEGKDGKDGPDVSAGLPEWRGAVPRNPAEDDLPSWNQYSI
jgi:GH24 family phage-related lysozyme (muramidase)